MSTNVLSKYGLPIAAAGLLGFAVIHTLQPPRVQATPLVAPPATPYAASVAGIGIIEPKSELIAVAADLPGVIEEVFVQAGDRVAKDAALFRLDSRAAEAAHDAARAQGQSAAAAADVAAVALADEQERLKLFEAVADPRAISADELARRRFAVRRAEANLAQARAAATAAAAEARRLKTNLDLLTVRAPIGGRVFQVNVRPGEFAPAGLLAQPLLTLGDDTLLHVRVEIDEADAARASPEAKAVGRLRGAADAQIPLSFVRFEPQAVEKRALSGGAERVDTRVIEAIYAFDPKAAPAFIGQRMDVFIEAAPILAADAAS